MQGENSEFRYSIMDQPGVTFPFTIDADSGLITTDELLDYEEAQSYTFTVREL